jgi:hypothetical protein
MNTNDNMMSNNLITDSQLVNKESVIVDDLFRQHGWYIVKNEQNWISYTKFGDETSYFDIKFLTNSVVVSIPIKNSPCQYTTSFNNYYDASEYIEQRFLDYIK